MPQLTPQELDQIRNSMATATDEVVIATIKAILSGGIDKVHPDLLRICTDEINARGISSQMMENRKRKKMKLTEGQARRAIRKWLFEFATDSGVSHRMSTDDKIAGKLGDDREDQPASTIPQEIPIIATTQMSTQLTHDMPPVEDPDFIPGTVEELGKSADMVARQVPHSQLKWFYGKIQDLAEEAIDKDRQDLAPLGDFDGENDLNDVIRPSQRSSQEAAEATNESWKRWSRMLSKTLGEAKKSKVDPLNLRKRKLTARDMQLTFPDEPDWLADMDEDGDGEIDGAELNKAVEQLPSMGGEVAGGEYIPSLGDMEEMANEMGMELDELPGFDPRRHTRQSPEERQADLVAGNFDGDAKLRELVAMNIYPSVRTLSGMKKKINAEIDPLVQMYATARPAFDWLTGWYQDEFQLSWNGQSIAGPDVYQMAIEAYERFYRKDQAKLDQLADAIEGGGFYTEAMAEIVMAPLVRKWVQEVKAGNIDVSSRKARNNFTMSDWILETVLNSGFGKSGNKRRAKKLDQALQGMAEFKSAMAVAQTNLPMDS